MLMYSAQQQLIGGTIRPVPKLHLGWMQNNKADYWLPWSSLLVRHCEHLWWRGWPVHPSPHRLGTTERK